MRRFQQFSIGLYYLVAVVILLVGLYVWATSPRQAAEPSPPFLNIETETRGHA